VAEGYSWVADKPPPRLHRCASDRCRSWQGCSLSSLAVVLALTAAFGCVRAREHACRRHRNPTRSWRRRRPRTSRSPARPPRPRPSRRAPTPKRRRGRRPSPHRSRPRDRRAALRRRPRRPSQSPEARPAEIAAAIGHVGGDAATGGPDDHGQTGSRCTISVLAIGQQPLAIAVALVSVAGLLLFGVWFLRRRRPAPKPDAELLPELATSPVPATPAPARGGRRSPPSPGRAPTATRRCQCPRGGNPADKASGALRRGLRGFAHAPRRPGGSGRAPERAPRGLRHPAHGDRVGREVRAAREP
jgi:hypothetical protein